MMTGRDRIRQLARPPAICPGCLAQRGQPYPRGHTTKHCRRHLRELQRQIDARREAREKEWAAAIFVAYLVLGTVFLVALARAAGKRTPKPSSGEE